MCKFIAMDFSLKYIESPSLFDFGSRPQNSITILLIVLWLVKTNLSKKIPLPNFELLEKLEKDPNFGF